jgi:hypothetical protein
VKPMGTPLADKYRTGLRYSQDSVPDALTIDELKLRSVGQTYPEQED